MGRHYLLGVRDQAAFGLFVLAGPLDLLYEGWVVSAHYSQNGVPLNTWYYGKLTKCHGVTILWLEFIAVIL